LRKDQSEISEKSEIQQRKVIWKDNRIQTNQANLALPDNKAASSKIARNRNGNANSVSGKNKVANKAVVVNRVVSKADDKPGYLEKKAAGGDSRCFVFCCPTRIRVLYDRTPGQM
jgi:hypothetical protein